MNCIILLLLLSCCGCGNSCSGNWNTSDNCGCERSARNNFNERVIRRERRERDEDVRRDNDCGCMEQECSYDAATMAPPSWREFPGLTRDCDCEE